MSGNEEFDREAFAAYEDELYREKSLSRSVNYKKQSDFRIPGHVRPGMLRQKLFGKHGRKHSMFFLFIDMQNKW